MKQTNLGKRKITIQNFKDTRLLKMKPKEKQLTFTKPLISNRLCLNLWDKDQRKMVDYEKIE